MTTARSGHLSSILVVASALLMGAACPVQAESRTWTDVSGRPLQAEFVSADADNVTLSIKGQTHTLPLARLSAADQAWIRQNAPARSAAGSPGDLAPPVPDNLTPQQIVELLLTRGAGVKIDSAGTKMDITSVAEIPATAFQIKEISFGFLSQKAGPFPWQVLKQTPDLRGLGINLDAVAAIQPEDMACLHKLKNLYYLSLGGGRVAFSPAAIAALPVLPSVFSLSLDVDLFRPADFDRFVAKFPMVENLYLEEKAKPGTVMAQALASLTGPDKLGEIRIKGGSFTASCATALKKLRNLGNLQFYSVNPVEWEALPVLGRIASLEVNDAPTLADDVMLEISRMKNLSRLRLVDLGITDAGLAHLESMESLRSLTIQRLNKTSDAGVNALQAALPKCKITND